ncbi:MAG: C25 family cysteine peptidase [Candidatus Eisenbacteria bacterium]
MIFRRGRRAGRSAAWMLIPVLFAGLLGTGLSATVAHAEWRATASTTIALTSADLPETGDADARRFLSHLAPVSDGTAGVSRRLVALPECDSARVEAVILAGVDLPADVVSRLARVEDIVRIREQTVAVVTIDSDGLRSEQARLGLLGDVEIVVTPQGARGPTSRNAGPFTGACERAILNYDASGDESPLWQPPSSAEKRRAGVTSYCDSVEDCASAGIDLLLVVADELHYSPVLQALADHHASYLGLNVGVVSVSALTELTAEALHAFIQSVYETRSAAHFGDGHLGFVVLVGDAYADDNATVMVPTFDGYGGTEVASDHYYACVSGDDDFEDVMIGRLSVGNASELAAVVAKSTSYMPLPDDEPWRESTLLVSGLFYTIKDDYVTLFDEYEALMPDGWSVDRIYRHDYDNNHNCSLDVVDAFNDGHLIVNYAGDGWISSWYQVIDTTDIPPMDNGDRLPIVLSMACATGWYDNTTEIDQTGSYDCFAEQIVNTSGKGAVACLASPRASDGGMFRTLTKSIYRAVFTENCVFLGETMAVAKLLHIQDGGNVDYARHFNLFGDPALIYRWDTAPSAKPELAARPHEIVASPALPAVGDDLTVDIIVRNMSTLTVTDVLVRVSDVSTSGSYSQNITIPSIGDWSSESIVAVIPSLSAGVHTIDITVDPDATVDEIDEGNNNYTLDVYVYPHVAGFPAGAGDDAYGPCVAQLNETGTHIVLMEGEAVVRALSPSGQTVWVSDPATAPADYGPEITPAVGDLDGDGVNEIVATRRMGLAAFDPEGQMIWETITDDPVGSPVLADADSDGDLDVLLATKMFFGGSSKIIAVDESGTMIWSHSLPTGDPASATPAAGDFDQDGITDFTFGTLGGKIGAASCAQIPPVELWSPVQMGAAAIGALGLADVDDDGVLEIVAIGEDVYGRNAEDGTESWTAVLDTTAVALAIGDVGGDGVADVVVGTASGTIYSISDGLESWNSPLSARPAASLAIADLRGDGGIEIVVLTEDGLLHTLDQNGDRLAEPIPVPGAGCASPFVADLAGDGALEVCVLSCQGQVFAFEFDGTAFEPVMEWQGPGGNRARSGITVQPFAGSIAEAATLFGRYLITGDVTVEAGATVTVLPDAVLEFDRDVHPSLAVYGRLSAVGHPGGEIVMRPTQGRAPGSWGGIDLKQGSTATLSSCLVSGASVGIKGTQSLVTIDGCSVTENTVGAHLTGCTLSATESAFSHSDSLGMYLSGGSGSVADCVFDGNTAAGLWCGNYASPSITRSSFINTADGDGLTFYRYSNASVDSCTVSQNAGHGVLVYTSSPSFNTCVITDNDLNGILCRRFSKPTACWSTISGNKIGVSAETGASPSLGDLMNDETGNNSIMGNAIAAVANFTEGDFPIESRGNWWGTYPPTGRIFIGYVRYSPCLRTPPEAGTVGDGRDFDDPGNPVPSMFRLGQCSPNPFNPVTSIDYDIPADGGSVDIAVFDVAGRLVTTLYSGHHESGTHSVTWDGRDDRGRDVASGIYFVRLDAREFQASGKMILLK